MSIAVPSILERGFASQDIITRDVVIIGGGATGTYAAVRLREDFNKSVVVIEKTGRLGGHTETYFDPVTGYPVDYGVQAWVDGPIVRNFTGRFNISLVPAVSPPFATDYIDFKTGKHVIPPFTNATIIGQALGTYFQLILQWPFLAEGYNLPSPIPADLLLTFGDFVNKYGIQAAVPTIWTFSQSVGDILNTPTIYIVQTFGISEVQAVLENGFVVPADHFNSELYLKASALLGADVLYGTTTIDVARHDVGLQQITVQTPTGQKLIKAKKILVTIPPTADNMKPFTLNHHESSLFNQWQYTTYYTGIIRNGVPDDVNVINTQSGTEFDLPTLPFVQEFSFSGVPGLHTFHTVSTKSQTDADVESLILSDLTAMSSAGTFPASSPSIEVLSNHTPLGLRVTADSIAAGFYANLYALQGLKGTFYTGLAWAGDYTSVLWTFTDALLPGIAAAAT
ncbi:FAD/NAD(P)-binding domain-containing protein [Mollisia scopiformis]|uniref:FAD/NAD(P)-binding domain-containing protein n=1 Tax=Mollisia scopiformis TaxID=149040 RepID=A0A194XGB0_MOLSC|nr:FAD/NAD(P)-binding domain-containing protein [Mollisia scopiformis]KUJ18812.1 FAD/NAD(P)-binding domain-containing protein [Mollisia scopiformis]